METRSMAKRRKLREEQLEAMKHAPITQLPDECLSHIFSFLDVENRLRSTAVCSRWRNLRSDAWRDLKKLDLIALPHLISEYSRLLLLCGRFLEDLSIPTPVNPLIINIAADHCEKLTNFRVSFDTFGTTKREHCENIGRLINKNESTLQSVSVENMKQDLARYMDFLLELPEGLVELQLRGYWSNHERVPTLAPFLPAIERLKNLKVLSLKAFKIGQDELNITAEFKKLRHLEIFGCWKRYDYSNPVSIHHNELEHLSLGVLENMPIDWIKNLVNNTPNLKNLKLQTKYRIAGLAKVELLGLSNLETLVLIGIDQSHEDLAEMYSQRDCEFYGCGGFSHLKKLVCTDIIGRAISALKDIASDLEFMRLHRSSISIQVLRRDHEIVHNRQSRIPLHLVVSCKLCEKWRTKFRQNCSLSSVESGRTYIQHMSWKNHMNW